MGIVQSLPPVEAWLDTAADSWYALSDKEYKAIVRRWSDVFSPLVVANASCLSGERGLMSLRARLPADVLLISGLRVLELANTGGYGAAAYRADGLRSLRRDFANRMELIIVSADFEWSCIFSHEAGAFVAEMFYECIPT